MDKRRSEGSAEQRIVSLGVLGPVEAWDTLGRPVRITRGQARVLALLLESANSVVGADVIQETLWPGGEPEDAAALLHTNVWTLRKLFGRGAGETGTPALIRRGSGYQLRVDPLQLDWFRWERLAAAATRAMAQCRYSEAKHYLLEARRLWRGEALLGLSEAFLAPFARRMEESRTEAELRLIDASLALGEHHELIPWLWYLSGKNPLNEAFTCRLMLALFRSGRQAEALEAYDACRKRLGDNGLVPTPQLSRTEVDILTHAPAALAPGDATVPSTWWSAASGTVLVAKWPPHSPPTWALGDAEVALLARDEGGEAVQVDRSSVVFRFDDLHRALTAAVAMQEALKQRNGPLGRFVVHDGTHALTRGGRLIDACIQLVEEAQAGQILVFRSAEAPARHRPPDGSELLQLGQHHLGGGDPAIEVLQLMAPQFSEAAEPFAPSAQRPMHNLVPTPTTTVGREALVEDVARHLSRYRLVTLTGPGGGGKTRVAIDVARTLLPEYRDGVWLVELEWTRDPELIAGCIADVLGIERPRNLPIEDVIVRELASREMLLVLDTCEHLQAAVRDFAARLIGGCARVSVLATSLLPLGSPHEHVVAVPPLAGPPADASPLVADAVRKSPAVRLFCAGLAAEPPDSDLPDVARICELVDRLPLTIVLAAARVHQLGLANLAAELEQALSFGGALDLLDASGKLLETMEWTFSLLGPTDQQVLTELSLFAGPFMLDEAKQFCAESTPGEVAAALCRLNDCSAVSLARDASDTPRYRLLQPVRDFGMRKLEQVPEQRALLSRRHAEMYLAVARGADRAFGGRDEHAHLARLDGCLPNLRAALAWALSERDAGIAIGLGASLWRYWFARGHLAEGRRFLLDALALKTSPTPAGIRALGGSSYLSWWLGDLEYTRTSAEETACRAEAIDDGWGRAWAPLGIVAATMFSSGGPQPWGKLRAAVDWFAGAGYAWEAAQAIQLLAGVDWHRGDIAAAEIGFGRALKLNRAAGGQAFTDSLQAHGLMLALQGKVDEGVREIQAGLELADRRHDRVGVCHAFVYRAAIARSEGDFEEAARLHSLALKVAHDTGDAWVVLWALDGLAACAARTRPELAARLLGRVEALTEATGIRLALREQTEHAAALKLVAKSLGPALGRVLAQGREMSTAEAVELALT